MTKYYIILFCVACIQTVFTWGISRLVSYMGTSNMISIVASCKEDCLAKLVNENKFLPEKLPVGLGGSWTGGCEPWRRSTSGPDGNGNRQDELTLEIETDLTCLFRNSLWLHNQVVAQQQQQQQQSSSASASSPLSSSWQPPAAALNPDAASNNVVPFADRKLPAVVTNTNNQRIVIGQHHLEEHKSCSTHVVAAVVSAVAAAVAAPSRLDDDDDDDETDEDSDNNNLDMNTDCNDEQKESMTSDKVKKKCKMTTTAAAGAEKQQTAEEEADEKARKREMHTINGRKRREKAKIELEVLQEQCSSLKTVNTSLTAEQSRLEVLVQAANGVVTE